jgi:hypothetical protein
MLCYWCSTRCDGWFCSEQCGEAANEDLNPKPLPERVRDPYDGFMRFMAGLGCLSLLTGVEVSDG